ncbi:hypothetical protein J1N35_001100 [Gossypium stocksii]|uniref:Uncharacterized protein n=1 Tax=Gossypium stocksii TaxID=47602 RepID=A0A9D4AKR0_9ROSI|nr:hypothetical protein J1N35_001100 [Gossypium stocksii]
MVSLDTNILDVWGKCRCKKITRAPSSPPQPSCCRKVFAVTNPTYLADFSFPPCAETFPNFREKISCLTKELDRRRLKRTRSSKTTLEKLILIDEEVKERFDSIFKHQPMMPEKGFNLKSNDVMVVPVLIRKTINALKWERFCDARSLPDDELV